MAVVAYKYFFNNDINLARHFERQLYMKHDEIEKVYMFAYPKTSLNPKTYLMKFDPN